MPRRHSGLRNSEWDLAGNVTLEAVDLDSIHNIEYIDSVRDLPSATNGAHTLDDQTVYYFNGFVSSSNALELNTTSPIVGSHGGTDGFIYTGGSGAAIRGTNAGLFMADLTVSAPGGEALDVSGDLTTEVLVESVNFGDPAGFGNFSSLGTIDGFRVPSFKGCNFEDFDSGLTLTGTPDKIFFSECPFREVTTAGVTCLTLASTIDVDIVDITGCYGKGLQSDTEFIHTEAGGEPTDVLQIRGTTFDGSVTKDNIITGALNESSVGVSVDSSWPLSDSKPGASYANTTTSVVTITNQDPGDGSEAVKIDTPTESFPPVTDRFTHSSPNRATYDGRRDFKENVNATVSVSGSNTTVALYLAKNGTLLDRSKVAITTASAGQPRVVSLTGRAEFQPNDYVELYLANEGGTGDITISTLDVTI
jgi:hypothetical protein